MTEEDVRKKVREGYGQIAKTEGSCCAPSSGCGCGPAPAQEVSGKIGYSEQEMASVPDGANLGLGCGNPLAFASIKEGDTVVDLGSGAGFDSFLAAQKVGDGGKVIGVDMTPAMLEKARGNAQKGGYKNVEFRMGEIENLPIADSCVDLVISNCVINLSPNKPRVFEEAFRVLRPGGRLMVSDVVLKEDLPQSVKDNDTAYVGCLAGAILQDDYMRHIQEAGFQNVEVLEESTFVSVDCTDHSAKKTVDQLGVTSDEADIVSKAAVSIRVSAYRPKGCGCAHC